MRKADKASGYAPGGRKNADPNGWFINERTQKQPVREAGEPQDYPAGDPKRGQPK